MISIVGHVREAVSVRRLTEMGFVVDLFPAFDFRGKQLSELNSVANVQAFVNRYSRLPSVAELGCCLSHLTLIKSLRITDENDYAVIFEDDALPKVRGKHFKEICDELSRSPFDIILLGYSKADAKMETYINMVNPFYPLRRSSNEAYAVGIRYSEVLAGAVGYLVKQNAVRALSNWGKVAHLADDWQFYSSLGLRIGHVNPTVVREDYLSQNSTLGHDLIAVPRFYDNKIVWSIRFIVGITRRIRLIIRCRRAYSGLWRDQRSP